MGHFYANIMMDEKGFTKQTLQKSIMPYYFYAAIPTLLFSIALISRAGYNAILVFATASQLLAFIMFARLAPRHLGLAKFIYTTASVTSALRIVLRMILVSSGKSISAQLAMIKLLRYAVSMASAWIGQGTYNLVGHHRINYALTIGSYTISLVLQIVYALGTGRSPGTIPRDVLGGAAIREMFDQLGCFAPAILSGASAAVLLVYLGTYAHAILFRAENETPDPEHEPEPQWDRHIYTVLDIPVNALSRWIVLCFTSCSSSFEPIPSKKRNVVKSGYIEGLVKVFSCLMVLCVVRPAKEALGAFFFGAMHSAMLAMFVLILFIGNISMKRICYILTFPLIIAVEVVGKSCIYKTTSIETVFIAVVILENIVHTAINAGTEIFHGGMRTKSKAYLSVTASAELALLACYAAGHSFLASGPN